MVPRARVLFIDAYDSFSNNIISLLETELDVAVTKIFIDTPVQNISAFLRLFTAVVCGPGPGHPGNDSDVGLFKQIWQLNEENVLPALGICLGFQSLALHFGGAVTQLPRPRHGLVRKLCSSGTSIFANVPTVSAVQYHSLHVDLGHDLADSQGIWRETSRTPSLTPLAWDLTGGETTTIPENPRAILMAVQHRYRPFWGLQFHPESICSANAARTVIRNWWSQTQEWWRGRVATPCTLRSDENRLNNFLPQDNRDSGSITPSTLLSPNSSSSPVSTAPSSNFAASPRLRSITQQFDSLTVPRVCELLNLTDGEIVILDSELRPMKGLGESSIIGLIESDTTKILYSTGACTVTIQTGNLSRSCSLEPYDGSIFTFLKDFLADREILETSDSTFCGGLMGYITYEAGLETIGISTPNLGRPDMCFAFVQRSIVLDHMRHKIYIQSLKPEDDLSPDSWLSKTASALSVVTVSNDAMVLTTPEEGLDLEAHHCCIPSEREYCAKIRACQEHIRAGESYELCLTDQTSITVSKPRGKNQNAWHRYNRQRQLNRAPFAAYVHLGPLTLLSSSPERFLCWSRPRLLVSSSSLEALEKVSKCQFRPIKGTVKKWQVSPSGTAKQVSLEEATAILSTPKERAENLMIVDLIRHDLHGAAGSGSVAVPALMVVEEYETVYQLVSVIEGNLRSPLLLEPSSQTITALSPSQSANEEWEEVAVHQQGGSQTGLDVLGAALPPGSMTGAPKRRACQLLRGIEQERPRSIYSGVVGYMCVSGKGDFSVVIRSAYRWEDENREGDSELWHIGAGGAVTDLSTEEGEWEEMLAKLQGTLGSFCPGAEKGL